MLFLPGLASAGVYSSSLRPRYPRSFCIEVSVSFHNQPLRRMLSIFACTCDVNGGELYSTGSSRRVQQAWIDFVSATAGRPKMLPQKLLLHVMQLSSHSLREPEDGS